MTRMAPAKQRLRRRAAFAIVASCLLLPTAATTGCGDEEDSGSDPNTTPGTEPGGLSVTVEPEQAAAGTTIEAAVVNDTDQQFTYGAGYELERQVEGRFEEVELPLRPVIEIAYVARPGETGPALTAKVPRDAEPGTYRVVIQRDVPDVGDLDGEFEVVAEN